MVLILHIMLESIRADAGTQRVRYRCSPIRFLHLAFQTFDKRDKDAHLIHLEDSIRDLNRIVQVTVEAQRGQSVGNRTSVKTRDIHQRCAWRLVSPTKTTLEVSALHVPRVISHLLPRFSRAVNCTKLFLLITIWVPSGRKASIFATILLNGHRRKNWKLFSCLTLIVIQVERVDRVLWKILLLWLGWLNTFETYFKHSTKQILNTVIATLERNRNYKFVWAEISFLSLWWSEATVNQQQLLKRLINNKQLEIVTGGWVGVSVWLISPCISVESSWSGDEWWSQYPLLCDARSTDWRTSVHREKPRQVEKLGGESDEIRLFRQSVDTEQLG